MMAKKLFMILLILCVSKAGYSQTIDTLNITRIDSVPNSLKILPMFSAPDTLLLNFQIDTISGIPRRVVGNMQTDSLDRPQENISDYFIIKNR